MDFVQQGTYAIYNVASLTSCILSTVRYDHSLDDHTRCIMIRELIAVHESFPVPSSAEWLAEWKEEFATLLEPQEVEIPVF
jgi:hypothetical protein